MAGSRRASNGRRYRVEAGSFSTEPRGGSSRSAKVQGHTAALPHHFVDVVLAVVLIACRSGPLAGLAWQNSHDRPASTAGRVR
jgi:hypothetical protein